MAEITERHRALFAEIDRIRDLMDVAAAHGYEDLVACLTEELHQLLGEVDALAPVRRLDLDEFKR